MMLAKYEPGLNNQPTTVNMDHVRVHSLYHNLVNIQMPPVHLQVEIFPNPHGIPITITTAPIEQQQQQQQPSEAGKYKIFQTVYFLT
jgi:hypothetical protein